jgi:hypothetical protein
LDQDAELDELKKKTVEIINFARKVRDLDRQDLVIKALNVRKMSQALMSDLENSSQIDTATYMQKKQQFIDTFTTLMQALDNDASKSQTGQSLSQESTD